MPRGRVTCGGWSEYIQPSELTPEERATMNQIAGPHLERLGYS